MLRFMSRRVSASPRQPAQVRLVQPKPCPGVEICARLLRALTGCENAAVTTGNAASVLLVAGALAAGREIIAAARDLVEISEGARISGILEAAGARVVSVGSANCVYLKDYEQAIKAETAMILRVRVSNMASSGYVSHVQGAALADLAHKHKLFYVDNLGGGSLVDLTKQGLPECPTLQQGIADKADLVLASGDKIIGGPQAGDYRWKQGLCEPRFTPCPCPDLSASQADAGGP